tara:strand:- start:1591 stop:2526 length:936 start_codon:yes stop_codon:yes gene_type:complete
VLSHRIRQTAKCRRLLKRKYALHYVAMGRRRLEAGMKRYIAQLRYCGYLRNFDKVRLLVYDFRNCKIVAINQNMRTSAASLIKPYVMLAVYHKAHRKGIRPSRFPARLQRHINKMIRVSNNASTNYLIRYVGGGSAKRGLRYINRLLPKYNITQTRLVELIPRSGRTYRNTTTARNLSILLYKIYRKQAVSPGYSRKMLKVLIHSRDNRGKTHYLRSRFDVVAATKTGYTRKTNGVAGIVLNGKGLHHHAYNYVGIITRPLVKANEWYWRKYSSTMLRRFSEMTYYYYSKGHSNREVRRFGGRRPKRYCRR